MPAALTAAPSLQFTPKVVLGKGRFAVIGTDAGDRIVQAGSVLSHGGSDLRVDTIAAAGAFWSVSASAV